MLGFKYFTEWFNIIRLSKKQALQFGMLYRKKILQRWYPYIINFKLVVRESPPPIAISEHTSPQYIVYIDNDLNLNWISRNTLSSEIEQCISRIATVNCNPCNHLWENQQIAFRMMTGEAIVAALENNIEIADKLAQKAELFLSDRTAECSRKWTLRFSSWFLIALILLMYYCLADEYITGLINEKAYFYVFFWGVCGAYLSIVRKAGKERLDSASGWGIHFLLVLTKMLTGGGFGIISYLLLSCTTICPPLLTELGKSMAGISLIGFISGFCEYFIPNIISKQIPTNNDDEKAGVKP